MIEFSPAACFVIVIDVYESVFKSRMCVMCLFFWRSTEKYVCMCVCVYVLCMGAGVWFTMDFSGSMNLGTYNSKLLLLGMRSTVGVLQQLQFNPDINNHATFT